MKKLLILVLTLCFLTSTFFCGNALEQKYHKHDDISLSSLQNMPPWIAFTSVALGGFKSLFVNVLWVRIFDLQEQDRYFELLQMANWLTDLQPNMTNTWKFQAWNIAYNILARFTNPDDRFRWLKQGIAILRDKAIVYNPKTVELYTELGSLFELKMTLDHDVYHLSYKKLWALEMTKLMGGTVLDYKKYLSLPETVEELTTKPKNLKLLAQLKDTGFVFPDDFKSLLFAGKPIAQKQLSIIRNYYDAFTEISLFLRRDKMKKEYKMDVSYMNDLEIKYGTLDWRLPYAHAVYWGQKAVDVAGDKINFPAERVLYQSLSLGVLNGEFVMWPDGSVFIVPNFKLIKPLKNHFLEVSVKCGFDFIKAPFRFFLEDAVQLLYLKGDYAEALTFYEDLSSRFEGYSQTMEQFVVAKIMKEEKLGADKNALLVYLMRKYLWWTVIAKSNANNQDIAGYADGFGKLAKTLAQAMSKDISAVREEALKFYSIDKYGVNLSDKLKKITI